MKKILKWGGLLLGGVLGLLIIAGVTLYIIGGSKASETHEVTGTLTTVVADSAGLAHGEHLSKIHACQDCHGENLGGKVFVDAPPFRAVASNLTSGEGGVGATYTVADYDRAIRYGVKPDGRAVMIMPAKTMHNLSDADAGALIAYLQSLPPVDNTLPSSELRLLGRVLTGAGQFDPAHEVHTEANRQPAPPAGATAAYGKYLTSITCQYCHGADLLGAPPLDPSMPPSPSLTAAGAWPLEAFKTMMRTGVTPTGREINPEHMPWSSFKHMTEEELEAIHLHLKTLAP